MFRFAIILGLLLMVALSGIANEAKPTVTLQFTDAEISEVLASLSQQAGIRILGDSTVRGRISLNLHNVSSEAALNTICRANKLEWYKTYVRSSQERVNADALFKLMEALQELGDSTALITRDPKKNLQTAYISGLSPELMDMSGMAGELKFREIYLVRAEPDPETVKAAEEDADSEADDQARRIAMMNPPNDPTVAAGELWGYFNNMQPEDQFQVLRQLGQMAFENTTPEQRAFMRDRFREMGAGRPPRGEGRGDWGRRPPATN